MMMRVLFSMAAAFCLKIGVNSLLPAAILKEEIHGVASYLEVLGALYGIVLAFVIFVVWDQFNKVQTGIFHEASALEDLAHTASFLSDHELVRKLMRTLKEYIDVTAMDESRFLAKGEMCPGATTAFLHLSDAVREGEVKKAKDQIVYEELFRILGRVNVARDARLGVSGARIPFTLWNLILFCSFSIVAGFLFLGIGLPILGETVVAIIAGCVVFLLTVIQDMDNPFDGYWVISYDPFNQVAARLKTR